MKPRLLTSALLATLATTWFVFMPTQADEASHVQNPTAGLSDRYQVEGFTGVGYGDLFTGYYCLDRQSGEVFLTVLHGMDLDQKWTRKVGETMILNDLDQSRSTRYSLSAFGASIGGFPGGAYKGGYYLVDSEKNEVWMKVFSDWGSGQGTIKETAYKKVESFGD